MDQQHSEDWWIPLLAVWPFFAFVMPILAFFGQSLVPMFLAIAWCIVGIRLSFVKAPNIRVALGTAAFNVLGLAAYSWLTVGSWGFFDSHIHF
jgi:hypothetical protein